MYQFSYKYTEVDLRLFETVPLASIYSAPLGIVERLSKKKSQ